MYVKVNNKELYKDIKELFIEMNFLNLRNDKTL